MAFRFPAHVALLAVPALIALSGCGSSGSGGAPATSAHTPTGGATTAHSSAAPAPASVRTAVAKAYAEFFSYQSSVAASERYLQHGPVFAATLAAEGKTGMQHVQARVTKVTMVSPNVAAVTFSLLSGSKPLLPASPGNAVREGGTWKVAAKTFCGLLKLQNQAPKACNDPHTTALTG